MRCGGGLRGWRRRTSEVVLAGVWTGGHWFCSEDGQMVEGSETRFPVIYKNRNFRISRQGWGPT